MAEISLSIGELFGRAFGYVPNNFEKDMEVYWASPDRKTPARLETNERGTSGYYGFDAEGREYYMPVTLGGVKLQHPVISYSSTKRVIETELTERRGSAKQLVNIGDWEIMIKGVIVNKDNEYPESEIRELVELHERRESLVIGSVITDLLLIRGDSQDRVVIKRISFPEVRGIRNARGYEIELVSDQEFDLYEI